MKPGDNITCIRSHGYDLTVGKAYEVVRFYPSERMDSGSGFILPAYVVIVDDGGVEAMAHATRFTTNS